MTESSIATGQTISHEEWEHIVLDEMRSKIDAYLRNTSSKLSNEYFEAVVFLMQRVDRKLAGESVDALKESYLKRAYKIKEFRVGSSVYPLRTEISATYIEEWRTLISLPLCYIDLRGIGDDFIGARQNLAEKVHVCAQSLLAKSVFQMTESEQYQWHVLSILIDIAEHKRRTPIELRKIGTVVSHSPFQLQWLEDDHPTFFDLSNTPSKLASFNVGDEFEAVVEFNRGTREVTRILSVGATPDAVLDDDSAEDSEQVEPLDWADF